nr:hypothetical protein [uncultured bacterium]QLG20286.1 hypothetical protein [uncultured bacterium]
MPNIDAPGRTESSSWSQCLDAQAWTRFVRIVGALLALPALAWAGLVLRRAV